MVSAGPQAMIDVDDGKVFEADLAAILSVMWRVLTL